MNRLDYDMMIDHVKALHEALTGRALELPARLAAAGPAEEVKPAAIWQRFGTLAACARLHPQVAARVPPFAFVPAIDVIERSTDYLVRVAVPGLTQEHVRVDASSGMLIFQAMRPAAQANGTGCRHAEIPRGPYRRALPLPPDLDLDTLRVDVRDGIAEITVAKAARFTAEA